MLFDCLSIEDDVFIGPGVIFANHKYPCSNRSGDRFSEYPTTHILKGASIGAGSVIMPGLVIGEQSTIGAGSVVTRDVAPSDIAMGNPARTKAKKLLA